MVKKNDHWAFKRHAGYRASETGTSNARRPTTINDGGLAKA
jgi:hypothetical protein